MEEFSWKTKINKLYNFLINYDNKLILFLILFALFTTLYELCGKASLIKTEFKNYIENKK
jgi:hypothetical protein